MKILQITPYYPPRTGGVENYVEALSKALTTLGHNVTIATMSHESGLPQSEVMDGIRIRRFAKVGPLAYGFPVGLGVYLLKNIKQFDVVHAHNYHALPFLVATTIRGSEVVVTPHFHGRGHTPLANLMHVVYQPLAAHMLRRAKAVICNSTGEANLVIEKLRVLPDRITIIPNIVASVASKAIPSQPENSKYLLLSVGRLNTYKRTDQAIKALCHLPDRFHLAIIGTGAEKIYLESLVANLGLTERVNFLGYVTDAELSQWYDRSNLVVNFSEAESFGRVLIEALQHQRRVVCSPIPAFRDLAAQYPDAITTVEADADDQTIASLIQTISSNSQPVKVNLEQYNARHVATQVMRIYMQNSSPNQQFETPQLLQ